jgi:hypothetical protein
MSLRAGYSARSFLAAVAFQRDPRSRRCRGRPSGSSGARRSTERVRALSLRPRSLALLGMTKLDCRYGRDPSSVSVARPGSGRAPKRSTGLPEPRRHNAISLPEVTEGRRIALWEVSRSEPRECRETDGIGAPGGIRIPNLLIRSQMLYPIELRVQGGAD